MKNRQRDLGFRWVLGLVLAILAVACTSNSTVLADEDAAQQGGVQILAQVGDVEISREQVEEALGADLERLEREYEKNRHDLLEQGLENVIVDTMVETEASSRGMTVDEFFVEEVQSKVAEVTDAEVDEFYEQRRAQIQEPKEAIADRIREFLESQQAQSLQMDLIESLRGKYGVTTYLEPLRTEIAAGDAPASGPDDAPVQIVEFSDFECPFCSRIIPTLKQVERTYGDKVRLAFRQFPLRGIHPNAQKAAEASLCADDQEKFWEMHDAMFADQSGLSLDKLREKAETLGLEMESFIDCLDSSKYAEQVETDLQEGAAAGVSGTPALFINGRFISGAQPYEAIAKIIDDELRRLEG